MKLWAFAAALAALPVSANATVVWSFYETSISCFSGSCFLPLQPYVLATLALPEPTSTGLASWQGFPGPPPVYTGDDFTLTLPFTRLSPVFTGSPACESGSGGPGAICDFAIVWAATAGGLAITLNLDAFDDNIGGGAGGPFGPSGGRIASDGFGYNGGCVNTQCQVGGFWQSDLPVPVLEPVSTASVFLAGLFGAWLTRSLSPVRIRQGCPWPAKIEDKWSRLARAAIPGGANALINHPCS